jgi:predicted nucleotidyltransferase component of viral defense system
MKDYIDAYLSKYPNLQSEHDWESAAKEIIQEVCLRALSHAGFFKYASFYGGTCLRIFHNLPRYSEDLGFSLDEANPSFDFSEYFEEINKHFDLLGFSVDVSKKDKARQGSTESAFIKADTSVNLLTIQCPETITRNIQPGKKLKVKFEVDVNPPGVATHKMETPLIPYPYTVRTYDLPSLYAGKLHALICRNWKGRVKGRDFYDFIWYVGRGHRVNLEHFKSRMVQSGHFDSKLELDLPTLEEILAKRFSEVDFIQAKQDVLPFISNPAELDIWSNDFFLSLIPRVKRDIPV